MMQNENEPIPLQGQKAFGPNSVPKERKVIIKKVAFI